MEDCWARYNVEKENASVVSSKWFERQKDGRDKWDMGWNRERERRRADVNAQRKSYGWRALQVTSQREKDAEMLGGVTWWHLPPQMGSLALAVQSGAMPPDCEPRMHLAQQEQMNGPVLTFTITLHLPDSWCRAEWVFSRTKGSLRVWTPLNHGLISVLNQQWDNIFSSWFFSSGAPDLL